MKAFNHFYKLLVRFRYPVSLPEDVASAIGVEIPEFLAFNEFVNFLTDPCCRPKKLKKFMPRKQAEQAFQQAQRKERFKQSSLYSFYFNEGWLEFKLQFDEHSLLRRLYVKHKSIEEIRGKELLLDIAFDFKLSSPPSKNNDLATLLT